MKTVKIRSIIFLLFIGLTLVNCSSDDDKDPEIKNPGPPTEAQVHQIEVMLVDIILDSGRDFPQFGQTQRRPFKTNDLNDLLEGPNNYLETINDLGEIKVRFWLDDEGNIIPSPTWQQNHPNYCSSDGRSMRAARELLEFKIQYDPELGLDYPNQYAFGVQLNLIDVQENAVIKQSVYVEPIINQENKWINATLNEAWDQMLDRATVQGAVGPCEAEIALSLHFTSEFRSENNDPEGGWVGYDKVEGVVALSFNATKNAFEGSGSITSVDGWATAVAGDPIYTPYHGELKVFELVTPLLAEGSLDFPFMAMTLTVAGTGSSNSYPIDWLLCHGAVNGDYGIEDSFYNVALIDEWDEVTDPAVVLRKTYTLNDFTLPGTDYGDSNITEHTVIEIRRD